MMSLASTPKVSSRPCKSAAVRAFSARRPVVVVQAQAGVTATRREFLQAASAAAILSATPGAALAAKAPKGFNPVQDLNDNYQFVYPFGWQEVVVKGTDVVYKDVIEPLESVSVTMSTTDKKDITEFGPLQEVCEALAKEVLSAPGQEVKIIGTSQREANGHNYYQVEFTASTSRYTRHQLAVVGVSNGNFYTLTTGANEKRWDKMKSALATTANSFQFIN